MGGLLDLQAAGRARGLRLDAHPVLREAAIETWRRRMRNEHGAAPVFDGLGRQLASAGADARLVDRVASMAAEERRHGELCGAIVEGLGGQAVVDALPEVPLPEHADVCRLEAVTRNVLSVCCLSETVAVALITAERERVSSGPVRDVLSIILADEIGHARLGWTWLAACGDTLDLARLGPYLGVAFAHLERHELAHLPLAPVPTDGARYGLCDGEEARALFYRVIGEVVLPRLEAHGIPATEAWARRRA